MSRMTIDRVIIEEAERQQEERKHRSSLSKRPRPRALILIADAALIGIVLCTFALFHHVLPQTYGDVTPVTPVVRPEDPTDDSMTEMEKNFLALLKTEPVMTDTTYKSDSVLIDITSHTQGSGNSRVAYYLADIHVRSIDCFQTALAKDKFGHGLNEPLTDIAKRHNALLAISGDYYGLHGSGPVLRNGVLYRDRRGSADVCVLYKDGTMRAYNGSKFNGKAELENGAWQVWSFGPSLLTEDGKATTKFNSPLTGTNPRCAMGYYEPGHYVFVLVDGRQSEYSNGMTLPQLSKLFESLGCKMAYNLDGGRTAMMTFGDNLVNRPYLDGRVVSDIVYIGEAQ